MQSFPQVFFLNKSQGQPQKKARLTSQHRLGFSFSCQLKRAGLVYLVHPLVKQQHDNCCKGGGFIIILYNNIYY